MWEMMLFEVYELEDINICIYTHILHWNYILSFAHSLKYL